MGMEVLSVEQTVSAKHDAAYGNEPRFFETIRSSAARHLAETILRDAALHERIEPEKDDPFGVVSHRWRIGIERDMDAIKMRERQMAEARAEGRREAIKVLLSSVAAYERVDGFCKHVLVSQLHEMVRKIQELE